MSWRQKSVLCFCAIRIPASGGPRKIGHDRNVAARQTATTHATEGTGWPSHTVSAHHAATLNSVATVWARNASCVKAPKKYGDGSSHNLSANWGVEGDSDDPQMVSLRQRVARSVLATVLVAGVVVASYVRLICVLMAPPTAKRD